MDRIKRKVQASAKVVFQLSTQYSKTMYGPPSKGSFRMNWLPQLRTHTKKLTEA